MVGRDKYDSQIRTEAIRPMGDIRFAAQIAFIAKRIRPGKAEHLNISLGKIWGRTADEAYRKMQKQVEDWIEKQPD